MSSMDTFTQISRPLYRLFISTADNCIMRCDLHVHSIASGMFTVPGLNRSCRESYNDPAEVYDRLKQMSMSIVTITDHDSIDGAEALRRHPDFFLSEEVTVRMPSGTEMHMGVYGITERDHAEIQRRRNDFIALLMYLTERKLFFSANHVFSGLTADAKKRISVGLSPTFRHLKRATGKCGRRPTRVRRDWRRGWEKSRLPGATRTPPLASGTPTRKCLERERWMNFSPGCELATGAFMAPTEVAENSRRTSSASCVH